MPKFSLSNLRTRLLLLVVVSLIPVSFTMFYKIHLEYHLLVNNANKQAMQIVQLVYQERVRSIQDTKEFLNVLAQMQELRSKNVGYCNKLFSRLMKSHPNFTNIALADLNGNIIASGIPFENRVNISSDSSFKSTLKIKDFSVGKIRVGHLTKKAILPVAYPITDTKNHVLSVIMLGMDLNWFQNIIPLSNLPPGSSMNVFELDGSILARYPNKNAGKVLTNLPSLKEIQNGKWKGTTEGISPIDGVDRLYTYLPLINTNEGAVFISVGMPKSAILANISKTIFFDSLEIGTLLILVVLIMWLGSEKFVLQHIRKLLQVTNHISQGKITARTGLPYTGEIGQLAKSFDQMVDYIQSERQKLFSLINELPGFAYLINGDCTITFFNEKFKDTFGDPNGRPCYEVIMGRKTPCTNCQTQDILKTKSPNCLEVTIPNGKTYNLYGSLLEDVDGSQMVFKIGIDITEKKQAQSEITRLDRLNLVGQMAAGIAHEVRNPMTAVRGFLQMLEEKNDCSQYKKLFDMMIREIDSANGIITDYLKLTKAKENALQKNNLNQLIKQLEPLIASSVLENGMNLKMKLGPVANLFLNNKEINQLILNLVYNGIEAMSPGGTITVRTYQEGYIIILEIRDEGKGIEQEVLGKLGTPFLTTKEHGTGLGLATCYSIASRHNANIEVDSSANGTTFRILFRSHEVKEAG